MRYLTHLLLFALPGFVLTANAETLDEAWATAVASHRQIAAATAQRDAATYEVEQAKSARLPQLGLSSAYTKLDTAPGFSFGDITTDPIFDGDDFVTAGAQVSLPIYSGGAINSGIEAAEFAAAAPNSAASIPELMAPPE